MRRTNLGKFKFLGAGYILIILFLVFSCQKEEPEDNRTGQELAGILQCNLLTVTHRFFEGSRPDPINWEYLTIEQAAADHHHIVNLLKDIYEGLWISSGASKSGQAVLFHKRFWPDDVDATVAYVAPIVYGTHDQRFITFKNRIPDPY